MRLLPSFLLPLLLLIAACKTSPNDTVLRSEDTTMYHAASVQTPPRVTVEVSENKIEVPPESTIRVTETAQIPATEDKPFEPAKVETTVTLPKNKGATIYKSDKNTNLVGSKGFEPPKPPTPTEKANIIWTVIGAIMVALGVFFCTPWGGGNFRVGGIIAAGGVVMAFIGKVIDQIKIPAPAGALVFILLALGVYYGYRVRHKQITEPSKLP